MSCDTVHCIHRCKKAYLFINLQSFQCIPIHQSHTKFSLQYLYTDPHTYCFLYNKCTYIMVAHLLFFTHNMYITGAHLFFYTIYTYITVAHLLFS